MHASERLQKQSHSAAVPVSVTFLRHSSLCPFLAMSSPSPHPSLRHVHLLAMPVSLPYDLRESRPLLSSCISVRAQLLVCATVGIGIFFPFGSASSLLLDVGGEVAAGLLAVWLDWQYYQP